MPGHETRILLQIDERIEVGYGLVDFVGSQLGHFHSLRLQRPEHRPRRHVSPISLSVNAGMNTGTSRKKALRRIPGPSSSRFSSSPTARQNRADDQTPSGGWRC